MSDKITITRSEDASGGRYEAHVAGRNGLGELTYSRTSGRKLIADHTRVDDSLRGTGVGQALVERLVADARGEQLKIVPLCSFIAALSKRHPEWSDVMDA